jgi:UDP-glucose 4-epimerase
LTHGEELIVGDLFSRAFLQGIFEHYRFTTVLHFAAAIVAPESVTDPVKYYANNTRNTLNLLTYCAVSGVERFIFSSTAAVYGMPSAGVAGEESPTVPINPYGTSKLMSEWMLRDIAAAHGMKYVALRYFNVAGADPQARMGQRTPKATHLIKVACETALGRHPHVEIFGTDYPTPDGTGVRDYIHIEDLASAHLAALSHLEGGGESAVLNVGYGRGASVREVMEMAREVTGVDIPLRESPRRPGDPPSLVASAGRIRDILAWEPHYNDLRTIVADAWRWEQKLAAMQGR